MNKMMHLYQKKEYSENLRKRNEEPGSRLF